MCNILSPNLVLVFSSEGFDQVFNYERCPHQDRNSLKAKHQLQLWSLRGCHDHQT